jgi:hypothetical protein
MKTSKLPREQNPYLLTGRDRKKKWFFLRWTSNVRKPDHAHSADEGSLRGNL